MNGLLLLIGLARVAIWVAGAGLAWYRKRAFVAVGFSLAALTSVVRAFSDAGAHVSDGLQIATGMCATPVAALIVMSFVWHQARERPDRWSP